MSMLKTLAKVAIGIAVAKGVGSVLKGGKSNGGGILGGDHQARQRQTGGGIGDALGGGLQDMMGEVLSGGRNAGRSTTRSSGGLGDLLEQLGGGLADKRGKSSGGLSDILGDLAGGQTRGGGGSLGEIFGDFLAGAQQNGGGSGGSFGDIFNEALAEKGEPSFAPSREQEATAALMLRAMIQAAKSDGDIDEAERSKLLEALDDVSAEERNFVNREMSAPVNPSELARQVPHGLEQQVYLMSLMGIDLDNRNEAKYLHALATELEIQPERVNAIHDQLGVIRLYN